MITTQQADEIQHLLQYVGKKLELEHINLECNITWMNHWSDAQQAESPFTLYIRYKTKSFDIKNFKTIEEVITCLKEL